MVYLLFAVGEIMERFDLRKWDGFAKTESAWIDEISIDSRGISSKNSLFIALQGTEKDGHSFVKQAALAGAKYALVKKDFSLTDCKKIQLIHVDDPLQSLQDIALSYRKERKTKVVAITGSYGKTLCKDLLIAIANRTKQATGSPESYNSQIGVPLSLFHIQDGDQIAFIEAGISMPGEMERLASIISPDAAILTNIGRAHEETLGSQDLITKEKLKLLASVPKGGWVLSPNLPLLKNIDHFFSDHSTSDLPFATILGNAHDLQCNYEIRFPDGTTWTGDLPSERGHMIELINTCIQAAWLLHLPKSSIIETLAHYAPEPMRTEIWKTPEGATLINGAYCSSPLSLHRILKSFQNRSKKARKFLLFGGLKEKKENIYTQAGKTIAENPPDDLYLSSKIPNTLKSEIEKTAPHIKIHLFNHFTNTANSLAETLRSQDILVCIGPEKIPFEKIAEPFSDAPLSNICSIHLPSVRANLTTIRKKVSEKTRIMVIVKALAYGTQPEKMAHFLHSCGINFLGLSYVEEAVRLRRMGISQDLFVLNATKKQASHVAKWDLEVGVSDQLLIHALEKESKKTQKKIRVHLHIDTGMSRLGCSPSNALLLAQEIESSPYLTLAGIMTHFAAAEDPNQDAFTKNQSHCFDQVIALLSQHGIHPPYIHASNSAALIRFNFPQYNLVRIGLAAFGISASKAVRNALPLKQALSLTSRIAGINHCIKGDTIGYGRTYTFTQPEGRIAVIPIGYHDGLHRSYSNRAEVIIRGKRAPIVGTICMDYCMVDITNIPSATLGDPALIFGTDHLGHTLPPEELAEKGSSIVHELITCLGPRIHRVFIDE